MAPARPGSKGLAMEEALRAYFWEAGYFVARGLPYRLEGDDVTDVDLWLYERPAAATRRRVIVDVKNKRSPKATERVIWTAGLRQALHVDAAIVATTDRRPATRRLARSLGITVLDGEAISSLTLHPGPSAEDVLTGEEWDAAIRAVDVSRGTTQWRDRVRSVRSSLLSDFGVRSANTAMGALMYFAGAAIEAQPGSAAAEASTRAVYAAAAAAAVSLDFTIADYSFSSIDERRRAIANGIRYGQTEEMEALRNVRLAMGLARDFAHNGKAVARQIEGGFLEAATSISAEVVAEYVARHSSSDGLFTAARSLEEASSARSFVSFDSLPIGAKSMLGVFLDFAGLSREAFARAAPAPKARSATKQSHRSANDLSEPAVEGRSQIAHPLHDDAVAEVDLSGTLFPEEPVQKS